MSMFLFGACTPSVSSLEGVDDISLTSLSALDSYVDAKRRASRVPGIQAAIVRGGDVVWTGSYGLADTDSGQVVTDETTFLVASVSKVITATALMQVWETGAFALDEPIDGHLGYAIRHPRRPSRAITYRELLTHTSGIRDRWAYLDDTYVQGDSNLELDDFLFDYLDPSGANHHRFNFTASGGPGEQYVYSNVAMALAGHMVTAASGQPFASWCEQHIFEPLGMDHTSWTVSDLDDDMVAHPHVGRHGRPRPVAHFGFPDYPSGSLRTSATQLGRFLAMVTGDGHYEAVQVIDRSTLIEMMTPQVSGEQQALGWYAEDKGGEMFVGHNGGETGTVAEMFFRPSDGTGFVLLMNGEPDRGSMVLDIEMALMRAADQLF
jgi:CubicO group peptidase (beta-lactamase class C family)